MMERRRQINDFFFSNSLSLSLSMTDNTIQIASLFMIPHSCFLVLSLEFSAVLAVFHPFFEKFPHFSAISLHFSSFFCIFFLIFPDFSRIFGLFEGFLTIFSQFFPIFLAFSVFFPPISAFFSSFSPPFLSLFLQKNPLFMPKIASFSGSFLLEF